MERLAPPGASPQSLAGDCQFSPAQPPASVHLTFMQVGPEWGDSVHFSSMESFETLLPIQPDGIQGVVGPSRKTAQGMGAGASAILALAPDPSIGRFA